MNFTNMGCKKTRRNQLLFAEWKTSQRLNRDFQLKLAALEKSAPVSDPTYGPPSDFFFTRGKRAQLLKKIQRRRRVREG